MPLPSVIKGELDNLFRILECLTIGPFSLANIRNLDDKLPLLTRKVRLQRLIKHRRLIYVDQIQGFGLEMFAGAVALVWRVSLQRIARARMSKAP